MLLTQEQVEHLADLARIRISDVEKVKFRTQLSSILEYVNKLRAVPTSSAPPTAQVAGLENAWREDRVLGCEAAERDLLLRNAPEREGDFLKVKGVFGETTVCF